MKKLDQTIDALNKILVIAGMSASLFYLASFAYAFVKAAIDTFKENKQKKEVKAAISRSLEALIARVKRGDVRLDNFEDLEKAWNEEIEFEMIAIRESK